MPEPFRGRFVAGVRVAYCGAVDEGERWVKQLRAVGTPLLDTVTEMSYLDVASIYNDPTRPMATYDRNSPLHAIDSDAVKNIVSIAGPEADVPIIVEVRHLGGAYCRPPAIANAVGGRDAAFTLFSTSILEPSRIEEIRGAHNLLHQKMDPWSTGGALLNFLGIEDAHNDRVRNAFAPADYARLTELKAAYDPDNMFRINHNIQPPRTSSAAS
jgi:hypothetical protein